MFDTTTTYHQDLEIFNELGLEAFSLEGSHHSDYHVGTVERGTGYVKIFMSSCGSQFWSFEVKQQNSVKRYKLTCGSGGLKDYWYIAEKLMTDMIGVTELEPVPPIGVTEEERTKELLNRIEGVVYERFEDKE